LLTIWLQANDSDFGYEGNEGRAVCVACASSSFSERLGDDLGRLQPSAGHVVSVAIFIMVTHFQRSRRIAISLPEVEFPTWKKATRFDRTKYPIRSSASFTTTTRPT